MIVNYVLMYGIPYVRYKEFEKFEDISKFLVHKAYVNYSIFKKLEDEEEIEMIYRDNDIHYLEKLVKEQEQKLQQKETIIKEAREYITSYESIETIQQFDHNKNNKDLDYSTIDEMTRRYMMVHDKILKILDKEVN